MDEMQTESAPNPSQAEEVVQQTAAPAAAATGETPAAEATAPAEQGQSISLGEEPEPAKAEEGKPAEGVVPEKYEIDSDVDAAVASTLDGTARKLGLTQEQMTTLVSEMKPAFAQSQADYLKRAAKEWEDRTLKDPEIGGANLKQNLAVARRAYQTFASKSLREEFARAGLDRHPEVIRLFLNVGRVASEDTAVRGAAAKGFDYSDPRTMYPNSKLNR